MKSIVIMNVVAMMLLSHMGNSQPTNDGSSFAIRHSVVFSLKYPKGSDGEKNFLEAAKKLSAIKGVNRFECLREVSSKNNFDYALSMEFESAQAYENYQKDPAHEYFVKTFWKPSVEEFMEIDYEKF